jgi:23S rRNA (uracil1939-C5)-methyltransferase
VAAKQRVLEDCFKHIGKVRRKPCCRRSTGRPGATARAHVSVRYVAKKGGVLVGFHERRSSYVADMTSCEVLPPQISALLPRLRELVPVCRFAIVCRRLNWRRARRCRCWCCASWTRSPEEDEALLRDFADLHGIQFWLQPKGPDTAYPFHPLDTPELAYSLPEFNLDMPFRPTEFTQVNHGINRMLIRRAMRLLDVQAGERIADFFCGLGNFSLPIARLRRQCGRHRRQPGIGCARA